MKKAALYVSVCLLVLMSEGCASIITGHSTKLSFDSNPSGAAVKIDGRAVGETPIALMVSKKASGTVEFSKEGYKPAITQLDKHFNPFFLGNFILGGFFGSTTDVASGAIYEYQPKHYLVTLSPADARPIAEKTALSDKQKAKEFIVVGYKEIVVDLRNGDGEYLSSMLSVLGVPSSSREEAILRLRALSEAYPAIPEFADRAIEAFMPN